MGNSITNITDKVMHLTKSMVYLAMRVSYGRGATSEDIAGFLAASVPESTNSYHPGVVERALVELHRDGRVNRAGAHWYPVACLP